MRVGFVGWRGMVGSVLMERMQEENDFVGLEPVFFSTSNAGGQAPAVAEGVGPLQDAFDLDVLKTLDAIVTCQGGEDRKSTRLNSSHVAISYAVFCLKKK